MFLKKLKDNMKTQSIIKATLLITGLVVTTIFFSNFQMVDNSESIDMHEYAELTERRVEAALAEGATEDDLLLAEGSLTALGWFVLAGNDDESVKLVQEYDKKTFDKYNGTDMIFIRQKNQSFFEMLNLSRFDATYPEMVSTEYADIVTERLEAAFEDNAGYAEFKLAEGSLCALGWMTIYGNGAESMAHAEQLMNLAYKTFPNSDGYYMKQSSEAYFEIINLGRFEMDEIDDEEVVTKNRFQDQEDGTVLDETTGLVWIKEPINIEGMTWDEATAYVATLCVENGGLGLTDGSVAGDWRMPTNEEWITMAGWEQETGSGLFLVQQEGRYWSSTTPVNEYGAYHLIIFGDCNTDFDGRNRKLNIWPVRNQ